eukprot:4449071-Prorocentrum_lima.AAC.1
MVSCFDRAERMGRRPMALVLDGVPLFTSMEHPSWDSWHFAFTDENVALLDRFVVYATHLAQ